jgi:hypothetical protein
MTQTGKVRRRKEDAMRSAAREMEVLGGAMEVLGGAGNGGAWRRREWRCLAAPGMEVLGGATDVMSGAGPDARPDAMSGART